MRGSKTIKWMKLLGPVITAGYLLSTMPLHSEEAWVTIDEKELIKSLNSSFLKKPARGDSKGGSVFYVSRQDLMEKGHLYLDTVYEGKSLKKVEIARKMVGSSKSSTDPRIYWIKFPPIFSDSGLSPADASARVASEAVVGVNSSSVGKDSSTYTYAGGKGGKEPVMIRIMYQGPLSESEIGDLVKAQLKLKGYEHQSDDTFKNAQGEYLLDIFGKKLTLKELVSDFKNDIDGKYRNPSSSSSTTTTTSYPSNSSTSDRVIYTPKYVDGSSSTSTTIRDYPNGGAGKGGSGSSSDYESYLRKLAGLDGNDGSSSSSSSSTVTTRAPGQSSTTEQRVSYGPNGQVLLPGGSGVYGPNGQIIVTSNMGANDLFRLAMQRYYGVGLPNQGQGNDFIVYSGGMSLEDLVKQLMNKGLSEADARKIAAMIMASTQPGGALSVNALLDSLPASMSREDKIKLLMDLGLLNPQMFSHTQTMPAGMNGRPAFDGRLNINVTSNMSAQDLLRLAMQRYYGIGQPALGQQGGGDSIIYTGGLSLDDLVKQLMNKGMSEADARKIATMILGSGQPGGAVSISSIFSALPSTMSEADKYKLLIDLGLLTPQNSAHSERIVRMPGTGYDIQTSPGSSSGSTVRVGGGSASSSDIEDWGDGVLRLKTINAKGDFEWLPIYGDYAYAESDKARTNPLYKKNSSGGFDLIAGAAGTPAIASKTADGKVILTYIGGLNNGSAFKKDLKEPVVLGSNAETNKAALNKQVDEAVQDLLRPTN